MIFLYKKYINTKKMEEYEPETEIEENIEHLYQLSILDEEYKLSLTINESFLEFKLYKKILLLIIIIMQSIIYKKLINYCLYHSKKLKKFSISSINY